MMIQKPCPMVCMYADVYHFYMSFSHLSFFRKSCEEKIVFSTGRLYNDDYV